MNKRNLFLLILTIVIALGSCAAWNSKNDAQVNYQTDFQSNYRDPPTCFKSTGKFLVQALDVEDCVDYMILENGCVIAITISKSFDSMKLAVACPVTQGVEE